MFYCQHHKSTTTLTPPQLDLGWMKKLSLKYITTRWQTPKEKLLWVGPPTPIQVQIVWTTILVEPVDKGMMVTIQCYQMWGDGGNPLPPLILAPPPIGDLPPHQGTLSQK